MSGVIVTSQFINQCCAYTVKATAGSAIAGVFSLAAYGIAMQCLFCCGYFPSDKDKDKAARIGTALFFVSSGAVATYNFFKLSHLVSSSFFIAREGADIYSKIVGYSTIGASTFGTLGLFGCTALDVMFNENYSKPNTK